MDLYQNCQPYCTFAAHIFEFVELEFLLNKYLAQVSRYIYSLKNKHNIWRYISHCRVIFYLFVEIFLYVVLCYRLYTISFLFIYIIFERYRIFNGLFLSINIHFIILLSISEYLQREENIKYTFMWARYLHFSY